MTPEKRVIFGVFLGGLKRGQKWPFLRSEQHARAVLKEKNLLCMNKFYDANTLSVTSCSADVEKRQKTGFGPTFPGLILYQALENLENDRF